MLSESVTEHETIVEAIRFWHQKGILPNRAPQGMSVKKEDKDEYLIVPYGYRGKKNGSLRFKRGQFELTEVTNENGVFVPLKRYNHFGTAKKKQDYIDALKSNNVVDNQAHVSKLIILTSECARSDLVLNAIRSLFVKDVSLSDTEWSGLELAFKSYKHTAKYVGYKIEAGGLPWRALSGNDYEQYFGSESYTGDGCKAKGEIKAVGAYIKNNPAND